MANFNTSPNMNLPIPTVGVDPGPDYANNLNSSLTVIDQHNHAPGSGVQINPNGININADLPFNLNNAVTLRTVRFSPQASPITSAAPDQNCVYVATVSGNNELFYNDSGGHQVQITTAGAINATSSGISSGTNSASFVSNVLVVTQSSGVGGAIDAASYILRYNGSYPSPSGNAIVLAAPSSLSGSYQITFPAAAPITSGAFLTSDISGVLSYTNVDNSTLQISTGTLQVKSGGITATQIANSTITGTQVASNINLAGKAVQENGNNVVVSNTNATNSLAVVRGQISAASGTIVSGEGFTASYNSGTLTYTISFTSAFSDTPAISVTPQSSLGHNIFSTVGSSPGSTGFRAYFYDVTASAATAPTFFFIAIGQRA